MRILFLGTHGQKNWGDELLLKTFIRRLSPLANKIYVNSYEPKDTQAYLEGYNVTVFDTKKDKAKLLYYLARSDALVFGGGSVLKELYVAYGGERYATLNVIDQLTRAAHMLKKPIYFCNIGVGPIETDQGLAITNTIVERASLTTVRDSESFRILEKLSSKAPYELKSDAVFSVSRQELGLSKTRQHTEPTGRTKLGINLCRNIENNDNWPYFIDQLASDILAWCKTNPNTDIVGVPMQYAVSNNNDAAELQTLADKIHAQNPDINFEILQPESIEDIAAAIDTIDIMIAERLHTLILSTIIGTPIVALEYDVKVTGIIKDIGLSDYGVNINKKFADATILKLVQKVSGDTKTAKQDLQKAHAYASRLSLASFDNLVSQLKTIRKKR